MRTTTVKQINEQNCANETGIFFAHSRFSLFKRASRRRSPPPVTGYRIIGSSRRHRGDRFTSSEWLVIRQAAAQWLSIVDEAVMVRRRSITRSSTRPIDAVRRRMQSEKAHHNPGRRTDPARRRYQTFVAVKPETVADVGPTTNRGTTRTTTIAQATAATVLDVQPRRRYRPDCDEAVTETAAEGLKYSM